MHITIIAGARPNFMKVSPIIRAIEKEQNSGRDIHYSLIHTGQHFDAKMSETFFKELNIPQPTENLNCAKGGESQAEQTAAIMIAFEKYLNNNATDLVLVVGDVTSTMACAIVAKKTHIKVAHVEAGIRSRDITMPEEINRMVTDSITDYFFTTTRLANENLKKESHEEHSLFFVGNVMIDTLLYNMANLRKPSFYEESLQNEKYIVLTLHRPNNVDDTEKLRSILSEIVNNTHDCKIVFPVHPRTQRHIQEIGFTSQNIIITEPLGYLEFIYLIKNAFAVITDSGGITEETTVMGIPCMTLRDNTERPETCTIGTNELIGSGTEKIKSSLETLFSGNWKKGSIPELWDGKAAERIVSQICTIYQV